MANANTNLLQINLNPTAKSVDAGARTSAKTPQLAQKSGEEKFSATLNKVSAKIEQQAQPEQTAAKLQPAASDSQVATPQGQNDLAQDAPQILSNAQPALISKIIPQPTVEVQAPGNFSQPKVEVQAPEIFSQPKVEVSAPEIFSQPKVGTPAPEIFSQPKVGTPTPEIISQPTIEVQAPEIFSQPKVGTPAPENFSQPKVETPAPENFSQPAVEVSAPEIISQPKVEIPAPENFSQPKVEIPAPENFSQPKVEIPAPENFSQPTVEIPTADNFSQPAIETPTPENFSQPTVEVLTPENFSQPVVEKVEAQEVADVAPVQSVLISANYFFTSNTETLLAPKAVEMPAATNLQTVLPQSSNSNSQSMLDLLGGKTWSAADVQASVSPQVQSTVENISAPVQAAPELPATPLKSNQQINSQPVQTVAPIIHPTEIQTPVRTRPAPMIFARFQPQQNFTPIIHPVENLNPAAPQLEIQPQAQPVQIQPTVEIPTQPAVEIPAPTQIQTPAAAVVQSVEISAAPQVQAQAQPQIQPQTQPISQALGVNVTVEKAPVSTPIIPVQQAPTQQFSQPQQQQTFAQPQTLTQPVAQVLAPEINSAPEIPTAQPVQISQPVQPQISQPVEIPAPNFQPPVAQIPNVEVEVPAAQPQIQTQPVQISTAEENSAAQVSDSPTPVLTLNNSNNVQQPLAQVQTPDAPTQAPREDFNVPAQIVQQARLIRTAENTEMVINLKPEHLGQLTLRISVSQNGAVNASFFSDNVQVRTIIENSLVQLRQELNDQGLKVENVQVYSGLSDGGLTNGQGQQAWQQNQHQPNSGGGRINLSAFEEDVDALAENKISTDGVDYKI